MQNNLYGISEQDVYTAKARWPGFGMMTVTSVHWSNPGEAYTRSHGTEGGTLECSRPPNQKSLPYPTTKGRVPGETWLQDALGTFKKLVTKQLPPPPKTTSNLGQKGLGTTPRHPTITATTTADATRYEKCY